MPDIRIEGADDFRQEVVFSSSADVLMRDKVWQAIVDTAEAAREDIKRNMPVDYGDAQGRWGNPQWRMLNPRYQGAAGQGIWREDVRNLTHTQGAELSPFEYIERLNEGSSQQAPAGFIDTAVERAMDRAEDSTLSAVVGVWEKGG